MTGGQNEDLTDTASISFMRKYPLKEIPGLISLIMKVAGQMKNAYKDYETKV